MMTTEQVAERLGVKPATVYAYVSRGLLPSRRNADGKASLFAKPDVDAFVAARKRPTTPGIQTGITLIKDGELYYRGRDAAVLARTSTFEAVVTLLWSGDLEGVRLTAPPDLRELAVEVIRPLPLSARTTDRLRVIVAAAAAADPLRFDTSPSAVLTTGRAMLATMVAALPFASGVTPMAVYEREQAGPRPLAEMLWHRLTTWEPVPADYRVLDAALILLADHDIAASTLAARVAASTRAHPYAVVGAGLAALDGPHHGAASGLAYALLDEALTRRDPVATIAERLRVGGGVPGFGHPLYPDGDPRAATLLGMLRGGPVRDTADQLVEAMRARSGSHPNIDFATAAVAHEYEMPADAGEAVFAVARAAGWLAHALEEYADRPGRFRPKGQYAGLPPTK